MLILSITSALIDYGYWGMGMTAFLAGSFIPFSSEAVMTALYVGGLDLWALVVVSTVGNVLGGMFNYFVGRLCNENWVYRLFRIKEEKLESSKEKVRRHGAWMGLLAWLPILGSAITIAMGILRVNIVSSVVAITIGKFLRYLVLAAILYSAHAG